MNARVCSYPRRTGDLPSWRDRLHQREAWSQAGSSASRRQSTRWRHRIVALIGGFEW